MKLIKASEQNLITMMAWFGDQESVTDWGGPCLADGRPHRGALQHPAG